MEQFIGHCADRMHCGPILALFDLENCKRRLSQGDPSETSHDQRDLKD